MVAALFAILRAHYMNSHFLHIRERDKADGRHVVSIQLAEEVTFLNKAAILKELKSIPDGSTVTIDMSKSVFVDQDVHEILMDFETAAPGRDIRVVRRTSDPHTDETASDETASKEPVTA